MDAYTEALADTVKQMFTDGTYDPHYREIVARYYRDPDAPDRPIGEETFNGARQRLKKLARMLQDEGLDVVLVCAKYYVRSRSRASFRELPPLSEDDARTVLPFGPGNHAVGLYLAASENDLILKVSLTHNGNSGAGKVHRTLDRAFNANQQGHLSGSDTASLVTTTHERATPEHAAELQHIVSQVTAPPEEP